MILVAPSNPVTSGIVEGIGRVDGLELVTAQHLPGDLRHRTRGNRVEQRVDLDDVHLRHWGHGAGIEHGVVVIREDHRCPGVVVVQKGHRRCGFVAV